MANYTIIGGDGKEYGSVSSDSLRKWIAEGRLRADSLAKAESDAEFRPLSAFPEFADAFAPAAPEPTEPPALSAPVDIVDGDYELDIGDCIKRGWELVKNNFWPVVGVNALVIIIMAAFNQFTGLFTRPTIDAVVKQYQATHQFSIPPGGVLIIIAASILTGPVYVILTGGLIKYFLKLIRREPATVADAFSGFGPMAVQLILLGLVMNIALMVGYMLCIIPGIYLQVAWFFAIVLVIDREMKFSDAMELSRKMVSKHWFMVLAFFIVYGLLSMAGVVACCIGIFVTMPIATAAWMYAYETIFYGRKSA